MLDFDIVPSFTVDEQNRILQFSGTVYSSVNIKSFFEDRGINDHDLLPIFTKLSKTGIVAGGCFETLLRGERPKDIDVFFDSSSNFVETYNDILEDELFDDYRTISNLEKLKENPTETKFIELRDKKSLKPSIQLIKTMWYSSPEKVIDSFDFTAAQFAMHKDMIHFNALAPLDVARKRLVLNRMTFPASTLRRMIKYTQKGYYICPGSLQKIANETSLVLTTVGQKANGPVYID